MHPSAGLIAYLFPILVAIVDATAVMKTPAAQNHSDFGGKGTNSNYLGFLFAVAGIWGALGGTKEQNLPLCYAAMFLLTSFVPFNVTHDRQNYIIRVTQRSSLSWVIGLLLASLAFHLA